MSAIVQGRGDMSGGLSNTQTEAITFIVAI
jgi:hypothetical protein